MTLLKTSAQRQVDTLRSSYLRWRWWALAATVAGLVAIGVGYAAWLARGGWLGLTVVGIGLSAAMVFAHAAASDLVERWRLALTALPAVIVLAAVLGSLVVGERRPAYVATGVVAALVALAVLAAAVVTRNPQRTLEDSLRLALPLPISRHSRVKPLINWPASYIRRRLSSRTAPGRNGALPAAGCRLTSLSAALPPSPPARPASP
jgi:hypothetical protein